MLLKKLDFLSPEITLYFKGRHKHSSILSGLITIISYVIILVSIIYYTLEFIDRGNPIIYYFNRYIEDAGFFPLNSSSIFHYFSLIKKGRFTDIHWDFNSMRIYGIERSIESYLQFSNLSQINHWVYELCESFDYNIDSGILITKINIFILMNLVFNGRQYLMVFHIPIELYME